MIRRQIVRAGWAAMVLLVLTSCGMKDRKQTYPQDEGVTRQQEQAGGQSEKHEAPGTEPGLSRKPAAGGGGNAVGAGNASAAGNAGTAGGTGAAGNAAPAGGAEPERPGTAVRAVQNLEACNQLITGSFFKAGDIRCGLSFELTGEGWESDRLKCVFTLPDEMHTSYYDSMRTAEILTEKGKKAYKITPETMEEVPRVPALTYTIKFAMDDESDPHISVKGEGGLAGDYYLFEDSLTFPDVFSRYLSRADLCLWPTENLWLLRHEIYAANGRQFKSDVLSRYFSEKRWYRGIIEPDSFSDSILSDVESGNISLIQKMENDTDRDKLDGRNQCGLEDLPPAPYLQYLGRYDETGLSGDLSQARDMGAYYAVPGEISVPASITREQLQTVLEGGQVRVTLNELTGESRMLSLNPGQEDTLYGFLLYEAGEEPAGQGYETGIRPDYNTDEYHLWQTSWDTVMKTVYKGDIYIMKGAVSGADTGLLRASQYQQEIFPDPADPETGLVFCGQVTGNRLSYNSRGHFTAIYYLGD